MNLYHAMAIVSFEGCMRPELVHINTLHATRELARAAIENAVCDHALAKGLDLETEPDYIVTAVSGNPKRRHTSTHRI